MTYIKYKSTVKGKKIRRYKLPAFISKQRNQKKKNLIVTAEISSPSKLVKKQVN